VTGDDDRTSSNRRVAVVGGAVALVAVLGAVLATGALGDSNDEVHRPWTTAEVSDDGRTLTLMVEPPGDPGCEEFVRIDVERRGDTAVAAAVYRRTGQEFCIVPCPGMDEPRTVELDEPLTGVKVVPADGTVRSCRLLPGASE